MEPSVSELSETVSRMENRFRAGNDPQLVMLMAAYDRTADRFDADLGDERDRLLSRGGALMLIGEFLASRR